MSDGDRPLLIIANKHARSSGVLTQLTNTTPSHYLGYFEDEHGDQWAFVYDRSSRHATLSGGDIKWSHPLTITSLDTLPVNLTQAERRWLEASWQAATALFRTQSYA